MVRQHWLLHDLLAAKSIYGTFDGSLFSVTRTYVDDDRIKVRTATTCLVNYHYLTTLL